MPEAPSTPRRRVEPITQAVIEVLADANAPMRVGEIRKVCESKLDAQVDRSTISNSLIKLSTGDRLLFDRTHRGSYVRRCA